MDICIVDRSVLGILFCFVLHRYQYLSGLTSFMLQCLNCASVLAVSVCIIYFGANINVVYRERDFHDQGRYQLAKSAPNGCPQHV
jgi:hypothetical protein